MSTDPAGRGDGVAALHISLSDLIQESRKLRGDVHAAERARKRATQVNLAMLGLLVVFVGLLVVVTWQHNQLAHEVARTNQTMADCTTPGGKCFEQGRARTGEAVNNIIRAEIFMAQCARLFPGESGPTYDRKLEVCVAQRLASPQLRHPTRPPATPTPTPSTGP